LGAPKSQESQLWEFWDSHLGILGQNAIRCEPRGEEQNIL